MIGRLYFAWCGDPNTPPVYLATTGNTHDGTSVVTTGDITLGSAIIANLGDIAPFIVGGIYAPSGLGIPAGARFIFGGGASVNLIDIDGNSLFATLTGSAQLAITGTFDVSSNTITGVAGLDVLTPGRRYQILGPGIPTGDAFTAPPAGETTLTLDLPASLTMSGVALAISGPLIENEPFDPVVHRRMDETIVGLQLNHNENEYPLLHLDIKNPGEGLLAADRKSWAHLSWDPGDGGSVILLFNGRVHGAPEGLDREAIRILLIAEPPDAVAQRQLIAASLWQLPWVDPVFLSQNDLVRPNPDLVLAARSEDWHTNRSTLLVSTSDCLEGEDGTLLFELTSASRAIYSEVTVNYAQPPESVIELDLTFGWTQHGDGSIDATRPFIQAFRDQKSAPYGYPTFSSLTGDGLFQSLPKAKANIGGGWIVSGDTEIKELTFAPASHFTPGWGDINFTGRSLAQPNIFTVHYQLRVPAQPGAGPVLNFIIPLNDVHADFPVWTYTTKKFGLQYTAQRKRTERVRIFIPIDLQAAKPGAAPRQISLSSDQIAEAVDFDGGIPIGDSRLNSYAQTDRGLQSVLHGLLQARAAARRLSRVVEIGMGGLGWTRDLAERLSCRLNATLTEPRMAMFGGSATGKIKSYTFTLDPQSGAQLVKIDFGCAIGHGGAVTPSLGADDYIEADYIESGYYARSGEEIALGPDLFVQSLMDFQVNDDGVNLLDVKPEDVVAFSVKNGLAAQCAAALIESQRLGPADPIAVVHDKETELLLQVLSMTGSFHTEFNPLASPLKIPMGVNLEAAA